MYQSIELRNGGCGKNEHLILNNGGNYYYKAECKYYKYWQCKNGALSNKNQEMVGGMVGRSVSANASSFMVVNQCCLKLKLVI